MKLPQIRIRDNLVQCLYQAHHIYHFIKIKTNRERDEKDTSADILGSPASLLDNILFMVTFTKGNIKCRFYFLLQCVQLQPYIGEYLVDTTVFFLNNIHKFLHNSFRFLVLRHWVHFWGAHTPARFALLPHSSGAAGVTHQGLLQ